MSASPSVPAQPARRPGPPARWVLHLDLDAFFASVEQLTRPTLAGRAVLVGGTGPRGVVAGASYEARTYGARSAMPMSRARRLVPAAVVLPPRIGLYRVLSEQVFALVRELGGAIEQVALDEAFVEPPDLADAAPERVAEVAQQLRARIRAATGLTGSVGAGSGKQLAKIASTLAKPDGVRVVPKGTERELLDPLPVRRLWGVGPVAEAALRRAGVQTIGALAALEPAAVTELLGVTLGAELHRLARGIDHRPVAERGEAKQVSAETTFDADLSDLDSVHRAVAEMTGHAHRRLVAAGRGARTVTVKIRGADFATRSRSETGATASTDLAELAAVARRLTDGALPASGVRLIGVSLSGLTDSVQQSLFDSVPSPPADGPVPAVADGQAGAGAGAQVSSVAAAGAASSAPVAVGGAARPVAASTLVTASTLVAASTSEPAEPHRGPTRASVTGRPVTAGPPIRPAPVAPGWRPGDDVCHTGYGHGWVQGSGHGVVTVRFETRGSGPGPARTLPADSPDLRAADPLDSLL